MSDPKNDDKKKDATPEKKARKVAFKELVFDDLKLVSGGDDGGDGGDGGDGDGDNGADDADDNVDTVGFGFSACTDGFDGVSDAGKDGRTASMVCDNYCHFCD